MILKLILDEQDGRIWTRLMCFGIRTTLRTLFWKFLITTANTNNCHEGLTLFHGHPGTSCGDGACLLFHIRCILTKFDSGLSSDVLDTLPDSLETQ
jgi:hypothetical protein